MKRFTIILCIALVTVLSGCGYTEDDLEEARLDGYKYGYDYGYDVGYEEGYSAGHHDGYSTLKPVNKPVSGTILSGREYAESEITVKADGAYSYVVSLKNGGGVERLSFFVRAGETVTVGVPAEYLYVYFASGTSWYGYGEGLMFGENTSYSKDDEVLDFTQYTWEYTLYPVSNGNFSETPSNENEFFG